MRTRSVIYATCLIAVVALLTAGPAGAHTAGVTCFPANRAVRVNLDTHLVLTFASAPTLGKSGQIRIYDLKTFTKS